MGREFTLRDLAAAMADASGHGVTESQRAFHTARYRGLAAAFGIDPDEEPGGLEQQLLAGLAEDCVWAWQGLTSPFAGYLEAPPVIARLHARFGQTICQALAPAEAAIGELLAATLAARYGVAEDRTVSDADLRRAGFDPDAQPPPDDLDG